MKKQPYSESFNILGISVKFEYHQGERFPSYLALDADYKLHGFNSMPVFYTENFCTVETKNKWFGGRARKDELIRGVFIADLSENFTSELTNFHDKVWDSPSILDYRFGNKQSILFKTYLERSRNHQDDSIHIARIAPYNEIKTEIDYTKSKIKGWENKKASVNWCNLTEAQKPAHLEECDRNLELLEKQLIELRIKEVDILEKIAEESPQLTEAQKLGAIFAGYERGNATLDEVRRQLEFHYNQDISKLEFEEMMKIYNDNKVVILNS